MYAVNSLVYTVNSLYDTVQVIRPV
eukprot:COSAG01_NODE_78873_length_139_cov_53.600000_1_plen_24_part_10